MPLLPCTCIVHGLSGTGSSLKLQCHDPFPSTIDVVDLQIYELEDPVEDDKGVVYENEAILGYLRSHSGSAPCPVSGAAPVFPFEECQLAGYLRFAAS